LTEFDFIDDEYAMDAGIFGTAENVTTILQKKSDKA